MATSSVCSVEHWFRVLHDSTSPPVTTAARVLPLSGFKDPTVKYTAEAVPETSAYVTVCSACSFNSPRVHSALLAGRSVMTVGGACQWGGAA